MVFFFELTLTLPYFCLDGASVILGRKYC